MRSVAFITLGCKVNQYETQVMRESLERRGYRVVAPDDVADVYVISTCTVTGVSDRKSRQMIRRAAGLNPDAVIVATGCYVDRSPDQVRGMPRVDLALSNREKPFIGEYLDDLERIHDSPLEKGARGLCRSPSDCMILEPVNKQPPESPFIKEESNIAHLHPDLPLSKQSDDVGARLCVPPCAESAKGRKHRFAPAEDRKGGYQSFSHPPLTAFGGQTRALVKIEDGCDSFCTYCIVPHVRGGKIISRPLEDIVREVLSLAGSGYPEIVLTGIHLGAYGRDMADGTTLADVLRAIHDVEDVQRIRLSSMEPVDVSHDLISEVARLPKCAHHLHVSLQSGSDRILKLMRRGYTAAEFEGIVDRIRRAIPDVGLSTDVMVGFPGETERDFRDTCDLIARVKFSRLHVFRYSPREGTPAARFPGQVQESVAYRRSQEIRTLGHRLAREFRSRMLGQVAEVLLEDSREGKDKLLAGFTSNYVRVLLPDAPDELAGRMIKVKLVGIEDEYMIGLMDS